jgi:hypothetical protein
VGSGSFPDSTGSDSAPAAPSGSGTLHPINPSDPPVPPVLIDIGIAALHPRNTWEHLPQGFTLGQIPGKVAGTLSDTAGFVPNEGGYIQSTAAFPQAASLQGTITVRLQRSALSADNSADSGSTFWDSSGNLGGGFGADSALVFTVADGVNNSLQWVMSAQPGNNVQIDKAGAWTYPGGRYANSHGSANLDPVYADLVLTWRDATYWAYFDGAIVAYGNFSGPFPASGLFSQVVIGGAVNGASSVGRPLGPYTIQRFQLSTAYSPPPALYGRPLVGFYGDSFVVQGGGVTGDVPNLSGSPTTAQVNAVQAQMDPTTSPGASAGTIGQDGFISLANACALKHYGGYARFYTAAKSGHGWAYDGMGGTTAANTPAIDDFNLGKTGFSDALDAAQPDYIFGFGSVNDVNNGVPSDLVGNVKAHFDYWADHNPNLKGIYYVETLSWELGPVTAAWKTEMAQQRGQLRAAFTGGSAQITPNAYLAGTRKVPVTYIPTYETWVQGANSARFLIDSNPDNKTQSSNTGSSPNGHPDAEGNVQILDAYVWPTLSTLLQ